MSAFTLQPVFIEAAPLKPLSQIMLPTVFHAASMPVDINLASVVELAPYCAITKFDKGNILSDKNIKENGTSLTLTTGQKYFIALKPEAFKKKYALEC